MCASFAQHAPRAVRVLFLASAAASRRTLIYPGAPRAAKALTRGHKPRDFTSKRANKIKSGADSFGARRRLATPLAPTRPAAETGNSQEV